jgi:hypothetical protein
MDAADSQPLPRNKDRQVSSRLAFLVLSVAAVVFVLNILLLVHNRRLMAELSRHSGPPAITPGAKVSPLRGVNLKGEQVVISYGPGSRDTLLLVFAPDCPVCATIMPSWEKMTRSVDKTAFRVVAVSLAPGGTKEYLSKYQLGAEEVLYLINPEDRESYRLAQVPQAILVDPNGNVRKLWTGLMDDVMWNDLRSNLRIKESQDSSATR